MSVLNIVSVICFAFCLIIFFYLKWYIKKRTSPSGLLDDYRTEIGRLIAEIDKATDRDSQLVEDRIKQLKSVIEETDKRISLYVKELEKSRSGEVLYTSLGKGIRAALSTEKETEKKQAVLSPVYPNIPVYSSVVPPQQTVKAAPSETAKKPPSKKQIRSHIDILLNEGVPPEEIASKLEISVAEVNLAMNLRSVKK